MMDAALDRSPRRLTNVLRLLLCVAATCCVACWGLGFHSRAWAEERRESFDRDPHWDGHNHRSTAFEPRRVKQDFGYSATHHAGGAAAGELGGTISPAAEPAYCAKKIPPASFDSRLSASGSLACTGGQFHALLGFFNAKTINEWRTPNTIAIRLYGRGDVFYVFVEYMTSRWRAGGDNPGGFSTEPDPENGRRRLAGFARGQPHRWSLEYDPDANGGQGEVTVRIDDEKAVCQLDPGHKADGAAFDRFGLLNVMKQVDDGGELWLDDITVNGEREPFDSDPQWDEFQNRRTYVTENVRPRFDFGFSPTNFAGGKGAGELGGLVFRGDCRYPEKLAACGDRLEPLTLAKPLVASGRTALRRGVSDSTTLIGFYHSRDSLEVNPSQDAGIPRSFLGAAIEGPSRDGFFFYPMFRLKNSGGYADGAERPHILPDGATHDWTLNYVPAGAGGVARLSVSLDGRASSIDMATEDGDEGVTFDRFGIVTTWVDGNGQNVYFDDLEYTFRQP